MTLRPAGRYEARCTCGRIGDSATEAGAVMLTESHLRHVGIRGHRVWVITHD